MHLTNRADIPPPRLPDGYNNKAGSAFFGIDGEYLTKVQMREIFYLVGHGFGYDSLQRMSLERRRHYYHLYIDKLKAENGIKD